MFYMLSTKFIKASCFATAHSRNSQVNQLYIIVGVERVVLDRLPLTNALRSRTAMFRAATFGERPRQAADAHLAGDCVSLGGFL